MRVALVINHRAGRLLRRPAEAAAIERALRAAGLEAVPVPNRGALARRIEAARGLGAEAVVVAGGDGTLACAAQQLIGTGTPLGILPCGTVNRLARDLGIPLRLADAVAVLRDGDVRAIDAASVNGRVFLCNSVLGFPARVAVERERRRDELGPFGWMRIGRMALQTMTRARPLSLTLRIGRRSIRLRTRALVVSNDAYEAGIAPPTRTRLDGGELGIYVARALAAWPLLRLMTAIALGRRWQEHPALDVHRARRLAIAAGRRNLRVMNDGEVISLTPPLRYRSLPGALQMIVPRRAVSAARPAAAEAAA
jgi:diacylglycerol kinase family enzyme